MNDDFQGAIGKVWAKLGLSAPRFTEAGRIRLRIEGIGLDLADSGTGLLLVEGSAGTLSPNARDRARQTRRVLETNLGLLLGNDASVHVKPLAGGSHTLAVRSAYGYRDGSIDRLVKKIEDVLRVIEYYAGELNTTGSVPAPRPAERPSGSESMMIFRP